MYVYDTANFPIQQILNWWLVGTNWGRLVGLITILNLIYSLHTQHSMQQSIHDLEERQYVFQGKQLFCTNRSWCQHVHIAIVEHEYCMLYLAIEQPGPVVDKVSFY
jgi:hypothetical protein